MKTKVRASLFLAPILIAYPIWADHGGHQNGNNNNNDAVEFSSPIVGSSPRTTIGGVAAGGAPWVVASGSASLESNGSLEVHVSGLLLTTGAPANLVGTTGPVQMVAASVVCGGSGGTVAFSSAGVTLNASGNAKIESSVALPSSCVAPVVLIRIFNPAGAPGMQLGAFIASSGITAGSAPGEQNNGGEDRNDH